MADPCARPTRHGLYFATTALFFSAPMEVFAATTDHADATLTLVEEITVHARKRDQRLEDTPVSISVVGQTALDDWTLSSLEDLELAVPNLRTGAQFAYNNTLTLRGVGTFSRNIGFDERVGIYQDGFYLGPSYGLNQNLLDVSQVEVLRGPQGTFFGRNSIAGAVTLISDKPANEMRGRVLARIGNKGTRILQGRVSAPLSGTFSISVAAGLEKRDGLTENIFDGTSLDNRNRTNIRAQAYYRNGDHFTAHLSLDRNELDERMLIGDPNSDSFGITPDLSAPAPFEVNFNTSPTQKVVTEGMGLTLGWAFASGLRLTSMTGLRSSYAAQIYDTDYSPADIFHVDYAEDYGHLSQELKLTSPEDKPVRYVFGLTYLDQKGETDRHAMGGALAPLLGITPGGDMTSIGRVDTTAWGIYGNLDFALAPGLTVSTGLRWSREEKMANWDVDTTQAPFFFLATGHFEDTRHDTDLSPTISLTYKSSGSLSAFVRYGQGFKSGGYNLDYVSAALFPNQLEFRKEKARSYEVGIKGTLAGGQAHYSATAFWVDYTDYQVNQFLALEGGSTVILISNAAEVRTLGLELEASYRVSDRFDIAASLALLDADYRHFPDGGTGAMDVSGNALEAPSIEASVLTNHRGNLSATLGYYLTAAFSYANGYYVTPDNIKSQPLLGGGSVPFGYIEARHQLGLKAGIENTAAGWRIGAFMQNALDENRITASLRDFFGTIVEARTVPRIYGLELAWSF
ncbi:MAG: TonB-dependent receptor [Alphaproteobacteria bacterium]|nr:TonB-dependent receptor [Alphaproteobacteria bacterium]